MKANVMQIQGQGAGWRVIAVLVVLIAELLAISLIFKHSIDFNCLQNWPAAACRGASGTLIAGYCIIAALGLFAFLFPAPFHRLLERAGENAKIVWVNFLGFGIALIPVAFLREGTGTTFLIPSMIFWGIGMIGIIVGLLMYLAPLERWVEFARSQSLRLVPVLLGASLAPLLSTILRPLWQIDGFASLVFSAVAFIIELFGYDVQADRAARVIGSEGFFIDIAPVCSGVEGMALVTIFVTIYLFLFKSELRFPRVLLLYPIGVFVSACLNVVRIVVLLMFGLNGNPELAVGGFHSHAGWLLFTLIAMGIVIVANNVSWFRKPRDGAASAQTAVTPLPFFQDMTVAMILPFAVFMFSAMLAQTFSQTPGVIYPARAALMAGVLFLFWPLYRKLDWHLDPVAIGVGAVIGAMWVLIPVSDPSTEPPYGALSGVLLVLWFVARGVGTILLVPIIEELFFRGYLEQRFKREETLVWTIGAAVIVAGFFALLHDRWAEAAVASLAFSYVMHRLGRVTDAILSHGVANAIVFAAAVALQKVHII